MIPENRKWILALAALVPGTRPSAPGWRSAQELRHKRKNLNAQENRIMSTEGAECCRCLVGVSLKIRPSARFHSWPTLE